MKLKIQVKLLLYTLSAALVVYIASTSYLNYHASKSSNVAVSRIIKESEINTALKINNTLNKDLSALRALAASVSGTQLLSEQLRIDIYKESINRFLINNPNFDNIKISWEMGLIDQTWTNSFGRRVYSFERGDGSIRYNVADTNMHGDDFSSNYYKTKVNGRESITGILSDNSDNPDIKPIYKSTILMPVFDSENNFCALVSGDLEVENFNKMVRNSVNYESSASFLITDAGQFAGTSVSASDNEKNSVMKIIAKSFYDIKSKIDTSGFANYPIVDSLGNDLIICGVGIDNSIFNNKWLLISAIPQEYINEQTSSQMTATIFIIIIGLIAIGLFLFAITTNMASFLENAGEMLKQLTLGNFQAIQKIGTSRTEELNTIGSSLNDLKTGLDKAVQFAEEIGRGNLDAKFNVLSDNDELGSSLLSMRSSLKKAREEAEQRQDMDRKQNWITEGSAKFGDILREYNNDMFDFSFNIISNLVKYIGANQGGLFVINDDNKDDRYFELTAGYAYNIRKILKKKVQPGVGLIGRCIMEAESIYISNLPEDYINISSGLGEKSPQYLLIVPFKFNNEIYAVAEIASFYPIEPYKQQFVEEVGNSIASTIATVKINIRTNKLLQELKVQADELASQEEEMRQNMEEMKATQEDMTKKSDEYAQTNETLNQLIMLTEFNTEGQITNINAKAIEFFKKSKIEVVNGLSKLYDTIHETENTSIDEFWLQLRLGRNKIVNKTIRVENTTYNIVERYSPVQNYYGKIYKAICLIELSDSSIINPDSAAANSNDDGGEFF